MTAALATLVFLSTLWLIVVLGANVLGSNGGKILAALAGRPVPRVASTMPVRIRHQRYRADAPARVRARMRAAA